MTRMNSLKRVYQSLLSVFVLFLFAQSVHAGLATVTVNNATLQNPIPSNFLGFSIEYGGGTIPNFFGTSSAPNNIFFQLARNLKNGVFRIGGNSQDRSCWDSGVTLCTQQIPVSWINGIFNGSAQTGFSVLVGLNLLSDDPGNATDYVEQGIIPDGLSIPGAKLLGFEIGNESDYYNSNGDKTGYTVAQNAADVAQYITAFRAVSELKNYAMVAPAYCCSWRGEDGTFIDDVNAQAPNGLALITEHHYPIGGGNSGTASVSQLLSPGITSNLRSSYAGYVSQAAGRGLSYRVGEMNSVSGGGKTGVSDTFASALWGVDSMFVLAQVGAVGVNIHCSSGSTAYNPVWAHSITNTQAQAIYYGMLLFAQAQGETLVSASVTTGSNVTAYATTSCAGCDTKVFVLNKDLTASGAVTVQLSQTMGTADLLMVEAPGLTTTASTGGISYGGQVVDNATGSIPVPQTTPVTANASHQYIFNLPNAAMALLTVHQGNFTPSPTCTWTPTFTSTASFTFTPTSTFPRTSTKTFTPIPTSTATNSPTFTHTPTPTFTPTSTSTATLTSTKTYTPVPPTATSTASFTFTNSRTDTPVAPTWTNTPLPPTATYTYTNTSTVSSTSSPTGTSTSTSTKSYTPVPPTITSTASFTVTNTGTNTPLPPSFTPSKTPFPPSPTGTFTGTATTSFTSTKTNTPVLPTLTLTNTPVPPTSTWTFTGTPTQTLTSTKTFTQIPSTSTSTNTPVPPTATPTVTFTSTKTSAQVPPTLTSTNTPVPPTVTNTSTSTVTPTPTFTNTSTYTPAPPTDTSTFTPTHTLTETPTITATAVDFVSIPIPYPNPVTGPVVTIHFVLQSETEWLKIKLYTLGFRKALEVDLQHVPVGPNDILLNLTDRLGKPLANGLYYLLVETSQARTKGKLLILR